MGSRWEMEDFWLYVGALGFDPGAGNASSGLGGVAFDASYTQFLAIAHFIFTKLDQNLAEESLKNCGYSLFFAVPQFWKNYCRRLKDVADEDEGCVLQIPASVFSFPLGPKLIHMFYQLARRVVIKELKNDSVGTDVPFAVELSPEYMYMADVRHRVAYNKLLTVFQREDFVLQEYEEKAQILIKERKRIESEYAVLKMQFCKTEQHDQNKTDRTEKIKKVRSMWTLVIEMLASLKKEKEEVDSVLDVLEDCAGQCVLDGANVFSVPRLLCDRVKSDGCQHCTGNIYEAENLNFLTVIKLLNEAQRALRDEHCQCDLSQLLQFTENSIMLCNELLQNLEANRVKIEQQDLLSTRGSISRKQEDWKVMWENFLGQCPFNLILDQSPVLGLLRALPPCSDVAEEEDEDIDFSPHLFSVSDVCDSVAERRSEKGDGALGTTIDESAAPATCRPGISSVPLELSEASENRDLLIGKNLHTETLKGKEEPVPPEILKDERDESAISETWQNADDRVIQRESPVKKEDPLKKFTEELAEEELPFSNILQVAKAVVSESPQSGEEKGMTMEDLISLLARNPFLTRKEIPRTPENLFNEIRSSWRKATETEGSSDVELAETEVMIEVPVDARLTMQKATDSRFVCSVPASPVPDFDPPLSESKSPLSSMECRPYKQVSGDHVESPVSETSGMQESGERTEAQELKCTVLNKSSVEDPKEHTSQYIKRSMNTEDTGSEHNSRTNVLLSDHCQSSSVRVMHTKPFLVSMSCESAHMGILEETLPELYSAGLNLSASSQSDFGITDSTYITGGSENHGNAETPKLDLQSVSSIYEVLEETPSGSEEKLHQTHNGGETVILATENRYESCGSPKHFCLDEEFTKTPSPESLNEKKNSLSSLLVSCQRLEEMASMVHKIPSDVVRRWKDVCDSVAERRSEKGDGALGTTIDESAAPATCRPGISSVPLELSEASENRDLLIGKNLHTETLKGKEEPVPPEILKDERDESAISETWQNADDRVTQRESPVKKEDPLKKFTEELAEEVAKAVVSESPQSGEEKGMTMEDLISLLAWNPFLTRKEIPRTPENLFNEIRSSWRKATETEGSSDVELAETEVMIEVPVDARLTMQKATDSRFVCSVPASPVPDFDPPLSESKSPLSSMECRPYKQVSGDHVESPVSETSGMQESGERTEAQELKCTVLNKSSVEDPKEHTSQYIKRSMNTEDTGSEHNSRTNVLLSDHCQSSSVRVMHTKPFLVSMSCESAHMGILEETLPELYSAGLNLSASSQSDFGITDSTYITGGSENHGNAETPKLDLQSVSSIYEVLEETPSGSEEKLHQTHNGGETVILATENRYESCGSPKHFCLDEEFTKTPSPESLNEKKNSLSSLLVSCQRLEEMASMVHKIPSDVVRRWKDVCDSVAERRSEKDDGALGTTIDESAAPATCRPGISSVPLELSEASENRDLLIGKNLHTETLKGKEEPVPPEILKDERDESAISETWQNADDRVTQRESPVKKEDPLKKFTEELAEEIKSS
ncbi:HAUS augmin-like complex subunit 6 isoform X2 [Falco biarmicus]|uniref:HAUS augmin-like complex subunit 6 isoform X2 n=1 Tax=Falco biarmicus TaxID=345155 RepID=UPI0024BD15D8|nr:HAUS augmin-like complex subunit 6 isoform X2 [Falco biarmicus]